MNSLQKQHLILIGFMGTGKSTVARQLSRQLELPFIEMDEMIVQEQHCYSSHGKTGNHFKKSAA